MYCAVSRPSSVARAAEGLSRGGPVIARGNGRSYGDSSLNPRGVVSTRNLDRMLHLSDSGVLTCEAGTLLSDVIDTMLPRGWFPAVTPGTKLVTVGGMIASDVHGKNHGAGSFCDHLLSIELALDAGVILRCSRDENPDLFAATCGGMGLTGIILQATFQLAAVESSRIRQRVLRADSLDEAIDLLEANSGSTYSVAWTDCLAGGSSLGRSVIFLGEHVAAADLPAPLRATPFARPHRAPKAVPIDFPGLALSRPSVRMFNLLYFHQPRPAEAIVDLDPYFYPLDAIHDWNRIYGRGGFVQYQAVLPLEESRDGMRRLLSEIASAGKASFLSVLKRMGAQSFGLLSFPRPGYTLALDFPATPANLALLDRLDRIVEEHGGRLYLAKDARAGASVMEAGYPRLAEFRRIRARFGLNARFSSLQASRLNL